MKILHVIDSDGIYGAEIMLLNLMMEHMKLGLQPILLSLEGNDLASDSSYSLYLEAKNRGLNVIKKDLGRGFSYRSALSIIRLAEEYKIDIIHTHGYKGNILLGSLFKSKRKIPVISTIHGWTSVSKFTKMWIYTFFDKLFLNRLNAVVYVNPVSKNIVKHKNPFYIANGIPVTESCNAIHDKVEDEVSLFCDDSYIVGCVSRLSEEKSVITLLKALKILINNNVNIKLVVIGDGELRSELKAYTILNGISESVLFTGYKESACDYFYLFDLFVLPSITEGLPITILEAMNAEIPIVATRVGAIPEVLSDGESALIVDINSPLLIAEAINRLKSSPHEAKLMTKNAKSDLVNNFSSKRMAQDYIDVYKQVIANV